MATAAQMAAMMNPNASYPLKDIPNPHEHDVLCGRGGGTNNHIGNSHWRMLVAANKQLYITLPKRQKMLLSRSIVNAVRSQNPPGRFLQKDSKTKLWFDVGDQKAQEKTSQALREGAPDIRKKVATEAVLSSSSPVAAPATTPATTTSSAVASASGTILPPGRMPPPQQPQPPPQQQQQQQQHYSPQQPQSMYGAPSGHMTLDERGMMVRQNVMMGNNNNNNYQQQQQQQQGYRHQQYEPYQQQQQQQYVSQQQQQQQQYYNGNSNNNSMPAPPPAPPPPPTFDEVVAAPPEELETQGLSFGSIAMTDAEMQRLQQATATGTHNKPMGRHHSLSRDYTAAAPMNALEPTGISIGDVSMMSAATNLTNLQMKLDEGGTSFGTMMSFTTNSGYNNNNNINADMVDGGLMDAVGTSFGSLSLDRNNRDKLFQTLELAAGGPEVPPMFRSEIKSSGNLLDCSDTESESSREKELLVQEKSQAWERMKTQLEKQTSKSVASSVGSQELMPPPSAPPQSQHRAAVAEFDNIEIALPTMEANFSTLSAWSAADDGDDNDHKKNPPGDNNDDDDDAAAPPPPPQLTKTTDSF